MGRELPQSPQQLARTGRHSSSHGTSTAGAGAVQRTASAVPCRAALHDPATLHRTAPHRAMLYCTILHYTTLYRTMLHYTTLCYTTLHCTTLHYTVLYYTALHCTIIPYCTTLYYTVLYYTALRYTVPRRAAHSRGAGPHRAGWWRATPSCSAALCSLRRPPQ